MGSANPIAQIKQGGLLPNELALIVTKLLNLILGGQLSTEPVYT